VPGQRDVQTTPAVAGNGRVVKQQERNHVCLGPDPRTVFAAFILVSCP
jgi:hypothetical protein